MIEKPVKVRRPFYEFSLLFTIILCVIPVATFCGLYVAAFMLSSAGIDVAPLLTILNAGLRDPVIMVIGGAVGFAFGYQGASSRAKDENAG